MYFVAIFHIKAKILLRSHFWGLPEEICSGLKKEIFCILMKSFFWLMDKIWNLYDQGIQKVLRSRNLKGLQSSIEGYILLIFLLPVTEK